MAQSIGNFIDRIQLGTDDAHQVAIGSSAYAICSTASNEAAKTASLPGFTLNTGTTIHIKFTNKNTAASPTLNVSNTGAKPIMQFGTTSVGTAEETSGWQAGAILTLTYDGTNWVRDQGYNTNNVYTNGTGLNLTNGTFSVKYGNTAGTAAEGNDPRLSDARTPTSHTHGNINNDGTMATASRSVITNANKEIALEDLSTNSPSVPTSGTTTSLEFIDTVSQSSTGKISATKKKIPNVSSSTAGLAPKGATVSSQTQSTKFLREDGFWATPSYTTNTNNAVTQTITSDNKDYRILFSGTDDDTTRTEGARKDGDLLYNPSSNTLSIGTGTLTGANYSGKAATAGTADSANNVAWANTNHPDTFPPSSHKHGNIENDGTLGTASYAVVTDANKKITTANLAVNDPSVPSSGTTTSLSFIDTISQNAQGKITATKKNMRQVSSTQSGIAPQGEAVSTQNQNTKFLRSDGTWQAPSYTTNTDAKVAQIGNTDNKEYSILLKNTDNTTDETTGVKYGKTTNKLVTVNPSTGRITAPGGLEGNADTATRINGNLGALTDTSSHNIWVSSTNAADGIPKYISGVYVTASTGVITAKGFSGPLTGNATSADSTKWLMNRGGSTVTISDGPWAVQKTPSGSTNQAIVWHQRWKQSGLTYTPSGGSATTVTDSGDITLWLSNNNTSNTLQVNMQIDGLIYAGGGFYGNGANITAISASNISSGTLSADRLATSGVTAGSYGDSSAQTPGYGSTFKVPYITVDNKGRVTAISEHNVTIPSSDNTTYTIATGDSNGQIKVTPSSGNAYNVNVKGLGSAAYTDSSEYSTKHLNDYDFINTRPLSNYVTFDKSAPNKGPSNNWFNGFVSSHNNYLGSYILNAHRSSNWYVGYAEYKVVDNVVTTADPVWYLLAHSGNVTTGDANGQVKIAGVNVSVKGLGSNAYTSTAYAPLASPALTGTPTAPTAANGTNTTQIATTAFVNNTLAYVNAMQFKGTLGTGSTITALPATHEAGDTYRVKTAGTYAGKYCEVGTLIICVKDGTTAADADWTSVETNEDGAVISSSTDPTDNAIARFDGTSGRIIQKSGITIDDNNNLTTAGYINKILLRNVIINNSTEYTTNALTEIFGSTDTTSGAKFAVLRMQANAPESLRNNYATGIAWKNSDTHGAISVAYGAPNIKIAGGNGTGMVWWIGLNGTSGKTYTFPSDSKTLAAADGSNATGKWSISTSGNADTATSAGKATNDSDGNAINSTYLKLSGGTMTGVLTLKGEQYNGNSGLNANNSDIIGINSLRFSDTADTYGEGICFVNGSNWDCIAAAGGNFYFRGATDGSPALSLANSTGNLYANTLNLNSNITFTATGTTGTAGGIYWSGSTDGAQLYYTVPSSDAGILVINMTDDANARLSLRTQGTERFAITSGGISAALSLTFSDANIGVRCVGRSVNWVDGRDGALIATTSISGYGTLASIKTTNGSWDIGAYSNSSYTDDLLFSYCTDIDHASATYNNRTTAQIKFLENGHIVAALDGNASTATAANLTTTTNAIAYYTNTTGTFGSKASANGALYATSANGALQWGTLPIAQGGTGVTSFTQNQVILSDNTNGTTGLTSRAYSDSTSAGALSSTSTNFVTERDVYFGLPTLNNAHNYNSSSTYYAPTAGGTAGHILIGAGATAAPEWYGGTVMSGSAATNWITAFKGTTDATATNAAAVTIAGGLGIEKNLYVGTGIYVGNITIGGIVDTDAGKRISSSDTLRISKATNTSIVFEENTTIKMRIDTDNAFRPETTNTLSLGTSSYRWGKIYVGTADSYGDAYTPIYWNNGVPTTVTPIQYCEFTIGNGNKGVKLTHTAFTTASYVIQIVVTSGESNLNSAIAWESATGYIDLTCSATSGAVSGYILVSRGGAITATATDIT